MIVCPWNELSRYTSVIQLPAPGLVELVEQGRAETPEAEKVLEDLLSHYAGTLNALVLGCTHYPFAAATIEKLLGESTRLYDGGIGTALHTRRRLAEQDLLRQGEGQVIIENSRSGMEELCRRLLEQ